MSDFLTKLYEEVKNTQIIVDFDKEAPKSSGEDKVIGDVGEMSKKIWSLHSKIVDVAKEKAKEHYRRHLDNSINGNSPKDCDCENFHKDLDRMRGKAKLLEKLFWMSVQQDIGTDKENLAIMSGWKVVETNNHNQISLEEVEDLLFEALSRL